MTSIWDSLTGKAGPTMDVNKAKALLKAKAKAKIEAKGTSSAEDLYKLVAINWEVWKIPTQMREQAAQLLVQDRHEQVAEQLKQDKLDASPQKAPDGLAIKHEGEDPTEWVAIVEAFHTYEQSQTRTEVVERLNAFIALSNRWVNDHSSSKTPSDVERVKALNQLTDWAAKEMTEVTKLQAEQIYLNDVRASKASEFPLQAITHRSSTSVERNVAGQQGPLVKTSSGEERHLTEAQRAAFRIFTGADYGYINPATAVNKTWLNDNKTGAVTSAAFDDPRGTAKEAELDKDRMSEGALHAGMLDRAMKQLPPYKDTVYRGLTVDKDKLEGWKKDKVVILQTMTSTSVSRDTALDFAAQNADKDKPIEVIYVIEKSGGRDIREFSEYKREGEIMVPAGTRFTVTDVKLLDGKSKAGGDRYEMYLTGPGPA